MNPISYQGTITLDEYVTAQKILSFRRRLWYRTIVALAGLFCLYHTLRVEPVDFIYGSLAVYFFALLFVFSPLIFRRRCRKQFVQYKRLRDELKGFIDEEGFHSNDDRGEPALTKWNRFMKWQSKHGILFLHLNPMLAIILPHRFFTELDLAAARKLLSEKIHNTP
ncbi:MAG TPA: hypothetical protein DDW21_10330 [Verrucomicrobiales bacterium]|nr:MAG: hypothetical protein B9S37_04370 [Verrucomicrobiae bacterium Tous-C3TDCM]PAZ06885.1 MAG: hypothetical protein CAK88_03020 [Verrucomicrobiae bacterium AMD-G2]HBE23801.1 hypothetical protein [Verrucomicrobiales bacterium]